MEPTRTADCAHITMVTREGNKLFAHVKDYENHWIVECKARDLQTFTRFQQLMADKHGVWMLHLCQQYPPRNAQYAWQLEVAQAFATGGIS